MQPFTTFSTVWASAILLALSGLNLWYVQKHALQIGRNRALVGVDDVKYTYLGHDFPPTLPLHSGALSDVRLTVEESANFPLTGWASDDRWFAIAPLSAGYVRLGPHDRLFVVTMFHELHCMRILNLAFDPSHIVGDGHINHCLGYLRQMTLCGADLTVEPAGWETRDFSWDRVGATHKCRDWSAVYAEVEQNYAQWNSSQTQ